MTRTRKPMSDSKGREWGEGVWLCLGCGRRSAEPGLCTASEHTPEEDPPEFTAFVPLSEAEARLREVEAERDRLKKALDHAHDTADEWEQRLRSRAESAEAERDRLREALKYLTMFDHIQNGSPDLNHAISLARAALSAEQPSNNKIGD